MISIHSSLWKSELLLWNLSFPPNLFSRIKHHVSQTRCISTLLIVTNSCQAPDGQLWHLKPEPRLKETLQFFLCSLMRLWTQAVRKGQKSRKHEPWFPHSLSRQSRRLSGCPYGANRGLGLWLKPGGWQNHERSDLLFPRCPRYLKGIWAVAPANNLSAWWMKTTHTHTHTDKGRQRQTCVHGKMKCKTSWQWPLLHWSQKKADSKEEEEQDDDDDEMMMMMMMTVDYRREHTPSREPQ